MSDFIGLLATLQQQQTSPRDWPVILGYCHSYDHSTGDDDLRRIRVNYFAPDGKLTVSPLLYRCSMAPGSDRQVPEIGALVIGLWTTPDRTAGVYLGYVQNKPLTTNQNNTKDWSEYVEGILTIKAGKIRIVSESGIQMIGNSEMENYAEMQIGDEPASKNASHIQFSDGFDCNITLREIYNGVVLDEDPDL